MVKRLCQFLKDIHSDNQSTIGKSRKFKGKFRHIHRRINTSRKLLATRVISVNYMKSKDNIVDLLAKGLNRELVDKSLMREMGPKPMK